MHCPVCDEKCLMKSCLLASLVYKEVIQEQVVQEAKDTRGIDTSKAALESILTSQKKTQLDLIATHDAALSS